MNDSEEVLDLVFNNEQGYGGAAVLLHAVISVIFSVLIMIVVNIALVLIFEKSFIKSNEKVFEYFGYFVLISAYAVLYQKSKIYISKVYSLKRRFQYRDLIFSEEGLKINPFLIAKGDEDVDLKFVFGREEVLKNKNDYLHIAWEDLIRLEVAYEPKYKQNQHFYYLKLPQNLYILNRDHFAQQEKRFFQLLRQYSKVEIINKTRYQEPERELSGKEKRLAIIIILITLAAAKYLGWSK